MKEAMEKEINYFGKHGVYGTLPSELMGTLSLIDRTSKLLYGLIKKSIPRIQKEIK